MDRIRKAIYPPLLALVSVLIHTAFTGEFDKVEAEASVLAIALGLLTYLIPNNTDPHYVEIDPTDQRSHA